MDTQTVLQTIWTQQVVPAILAVTGVLFSVLTTMAIAWLKGKKKADVIEQTVFAVEKELAGKPGEAKLVEVLKRLGADPRVKVWTQHEVEAAVAKLPDTPPAVATATELATALVPALDGLPEEAKAKLMGALGKSLEGAGGGK